MTSPLSQIKLGFQELEVADEVKQTALDHLSRWLVEPTFAAYRPQLDGLIAQGAWATLLDGFYRTVPFGTGGRRGAVGIGPNRINPWTVATLAQGHAKAAAKRQRKAEMASQVALHKHSFPRVHHHPLAKHCDLKMNGSPRRATCDLCPRNWLFFGAADQKALYSCEKCDWNGSSARHGGDVQHLPCCTMQKCREWNKSL